MIFHLDTHVAVWLRMGDLRRLRPIRQRLAKEQLLVSPFAILELQMLFEIGRLREPARWLVDRLGADHGLEVATAEAEAAPARAIDLSFTRDPYDRLIAGHALAANATLLTADENLLRHLSCALWR